MLLSFSFFFFRFFFRGETKNVVEAPWFFGSRLQTKVGEGKGFLLSVALPVEPILLDEPGKASSAMNMGVLAIELRNVSKTVCFLVSLIKQRADSPDILLNNM